MYRALCFATILLMACSPADPGPGDAFIDDYLAAEGLDPTDCGQVSPGHCGTWTPTAGEQAAMQCLMDHLDNCEAARLRQVLPTIEGDPIIYTYVVVPVNQGCEVSQFIDTTLDGFGVPAVGRWLCQSAIWEPSCDRIEGVGCSGPVETWE